MVDMMAKALEEQAAMQAEMDWQMTHSGARHVRIRRPWPPYHTDGYLGTHTDGYLGTYTEFRPDTHMEVDIDV